MCAGNVEYVYIQKVQSVPYCRGNDEENTDLDRVYFLAPEGFCLRQKIHICVFGELVHTMPAMHVWYPHKGGCGSLVWYTFHTEIACDKASIFLCCFNFERILSKSW